MAFLKPILLFILEEEDCFYTAHDVDRVICAELSPDPQILPEGPDRKEALRLEVIVMNKWSIHVAPTAKMAMVNAKGISKSSADATAWDEDAFYPQYRPRSP